MDPEDSFDVFIRSLDFRRVLDRPNGNLEPDIGSSAGGVEFSTFYASVG